MTMVTFDPLLLFFLFEKLFCPSFPRPVDVAASYWLVGCDTIAFYMSRHTSPMSYAPISYAPMSYAPMSYAPISYAPMSYAPMSYAPMSYAPISYAPMSYAPISYATCHITLMSSNQRRGRWEPSLYKASTTIQKKRREKQLPWTVAMDINCLVLTLIGLVITLTITITMMLIRLVEHS